MAEERNVFTRVYEAILNREKTMATKEAPASKKANTVIKKIGLAFTKGGGGGRDTFDGPEGFDFLEIERAYLTDSYIRLAVDKYVDFMFKAGWDITGKNLNAVEYVKLRLSVIAQATLTPINQLFIDITEELVKYHNVFIIKARASGSYTFPPGITANPLDGKKPVAGYFLLPTSTVTIARDGKGTVTKYQQEVPGGEDAIEIKPDDMIHIYLDKQPGRAFGFPFIWEALDDVKLLRQLEELVDRMIYKNIFPLMAYQVGLEQEGFQATDEEIEEVREMLGELTLDGGIVLPERHNIKIIGSEGKSLDVSGYLKYFEQRVFTGLGVSDMMMGRGGTSNRSTSDTMDAAFKDRIKAYQRVTANFITSFIINELLVEGGFDPILNVDDAVEFRFKEIDFDSKIKEENHLIQQFTQNVITHEEMREAMGLDPVTDEGRLYFNMVTAALSAEAALDKADAANAQGDNKNQPANQHKKKDSPKKEFVESHKDLSPIVKDRWEGIKTEIAELALSGSLTKSMVSILVNTASLQLRKEIESTCHLVYSEGYIDLLLDIEEDITNVNIDFGKYKESSRVNISRSFDRLVNKDLIGKLEHTIESSQGHNLVANITGVFYSFEYRLKSIYRTEAAKAYNIGFAKAAKNRGIKNLNVETFDACEECQSRAGDINIQTQSLPPFHTNCECRLTLTKKEGE